MANPPRAQNLKILQGTDRKDRRKRLKSHQEPSRCPPVPLTLSEAAKAEWKALAPVAYRLGTLTRADVRAFCLLCECLATEHEARAIVAAEGLTVGTQTHPASRILATARQQSANLLKEFGLTPKSRTGVDLETEKPDSSFDEFLE